MHKRKHDRDEGNRAVKKIKESIEKTTLGDLDVLSNLKSEMEQTEKNTPAKPKKTETNNSAHMESPDEESGASEEDKNESN
jgi:small subunit ribosomal protein S1